MREGWKQIDLRAEGEEKARDGDKHLVDAATPLDADGGTPEVGNDGKRASSRSKCEQARGN